MNYQLKEKEVRANKYIIATPYCSLNHLLHYKIRIGYTANNVEGWKSDIYQIYPNTVISTGYRPIGKYIIPYETLQEYEQKAKDIMRKYNYKNSICEKKLDKLIDSLIECYKKLIKK